MAVPVIFTLAGSGPGERAAIERTEAEAAEAAAPAAANEFTAAGEARRWRSRGHDSAGRLRAILAAKAPPPIDAIAPPVLNPLTRLALSADAAGGFALRGYEGAEPATAVLSLPHGVDRA
ncbi:MAG: hypothetical protein AAFV49_13415 [Pseudomonadota bacterium]